MLRLPPRLPTVRTLAFSPDNRHLLAVGRKLLLGGLLASNSVALWELANPTAKPRARIDHGLHPIAGFFLPDGRMLGVDNIGLTTTALPGGRHHLTCSEGTGPRVEPVAVSGDGQWLALIGRNHFTCNPLGDGRHWRVEFPGGFEGLSAAFSPDSGCVAVFFDAPLDYPFLEDHPRGAIYDTTTGTELASLPRWFTDLERIAWSPDGRFIAASGWGGFRVLEVESGVTLVEREWTEREQDARLTAAAFHPAGDYFVTGHRGGLLRFWDVRRWEADREIDWGVGRIQALAFSPDGTLGAVAGEQGEVVVWDVDV